jgi:hypothetical protein
VEVYEMGEFFVMLYSENGYLPLMENEDEIAFFETEIEAKECAGANPLGSHYGFDVFEKGCGV